MNSPRRSRILFQLFGRLFLLLCVVPVFSASQTKEESRLNGSATSVYDSLYGAFTINNFVSWHRYDGISNRSPSGNLGGYFPANTANVIFQDGLIWGGKVFKDSSYQSPFSSDPLNQNIRVGGSQYRTGVRGGAVSGWGATATAESSSVPGVQMYRIRRDYAMTTDYDKLLDAQIQFEYASITDVPYTEMELIKPHYDHDWWQWPSSRGAPFIDRNGDRAYTPPPRFNEDWNTGPLFSAESLLTQKKDEPGVAFTPTSRPADQVLWSVFHDLDTTATRSMWGSYPLGLEIQKTVFGYKWGGGHTSLENGYFTRYRLINKGGIDTADSPGMQKGSFWIDSLYLGLWSDPDLGSFSDDLHGCDTVLQMVYTYNGNATDASFSQFNLPPPAIGFVLLLGPTVPSPGQDALWLSGKRQNERNLPMSSYTYFSTGDPYSDPPGGTGNYIKGTGQWWKMLRGYASLGDLTTQDYVYEHPPTIPPSFFPLSGDPVTGTGWIGGQGTPWSYLAGDVRQTISTGPFQMAPGDTQEVLYATIGGLGADNLSSISVLRYYARMARLFVENDFEAPSGLYNPDVRVVPLDGALLLEWGSNTERVRQTEQSNPNGIYAFEGYTVSYSTGLRWPLNWKPFITYDRVNGITAIYDDVIDQTTGNLVHKVVQQGTDRGVRRYMLVTRDINNQPLVNGTPYTFLVSAYNYTSDTRFSPRSIESSTVISGVPGRPVDLNIVTQTGDSLTVVHDAGSATTRIVPLVVDPTAGNGRTYEVRFDTVGGVRSWSVRDAASGQLYLSDQHNFTSYDDYMMIPGGVLLIVRDEGAVPAGPNDMFSFTIPAPQTGLEVERENVKRVGVFPNPIYLTSSERLAEGGYRHVRFINLPERAIIRIYNLAGHLVRTLRKDSQSIFQEWDLTNEANWLIASGIYVVHLEFPDLQTSAVLKLGVIQGYPVE